jgi:hypothetical protein
MKEAMKMKNLAFIFLRLILHSVVSVLLLSIAASEIVRATVDQRATAFVLCKNQKTVRTIRVTPDAKQDNCTITYSKNGEDETVGSNRSLNSCKSILAKIRDNLENSNWNCRDVSKATLTTSSPDSSNPTSTQ